MTTDPEIANKIQTNEYTTNYHDQGSGEVVLLLHGSGAGVTAWANWRLLMPVLAQSRRVIAPDLVGFGYTETPADYPFRFMDSWVDQVIALLDGLGIARAHVVGNSFGGALTLALAAAHPERFGRLILMGPGGWPAPVKPELEVLWGYKPSLENMKAILDVMAYDRSLVTDELAAMRYKATLRPGSQENFERMFPAPRQRWLDAQVVPIAKLQAIDHETLIIHGRDDRVVDPLVSWNLHQHLKNSQLHVFGKCGHWTQIEHAARFQHLVRWFLDEASGG